MHAALPEQAAPNPIEPREGWKQERATLSPSARL